jgi:hypothetical protein
MTITDWILLLTLVVSTGIFGLVGRILFAIGALSKWQQTIDKEVTSHGSMLQQLTSSVARILGRLEDGRDNTKDGE